MNTQKQKYNCEYFELMINDRLEGTLSEANSTILDSHLQACESCNKYLNDITALLGQISKLPNEIKPGKDLWTAIEAKINLTEQSNIYPIGQQNNKADETFTYVKRRFGFRYIFTGLAAAIILFGIIFTISLFNKRGNDNNLNTGIDVNVGAFWKVSTLQGTPSVSGKPFFNTDSISEGQYITTDSVSKAELKVGDIGTIIIEPGSKVKLLKTAAGNSRLKLEYGSIDAKMNAPPKTFYVETVSATAVDLGCSYRLTIDTAGDGILFVRSGMVSLQSANRESLVPAGKYCITRKDFGPGTPFREGISPEMKKALMQFDFGECASSCIKTIVRNAQKSDAVTLINILPRVDDEYKPIVYEKVAYYYAPPKHIPHDSIPKLDKLDKLNEWIEVIVEDVHKNIEENMKDIDKQIRIHIDKDFEYKFDSDLWAKEWKEEMEKNKENWKKFKYYHVPGDTVIEFDDEEFKKEMQELQEELNEMNIEIEKNNEEIKIEMKKLKEDLKEMNKELKIQLKEQLKDVDEQVKEQLKDINIKIITDSTDASDTTRHKNVIIKIKKDKGEEPDSANHNDDK